MIVSNNGMQRDSNAITIGGSSKIGSDASCICHSDLAVVHKPVVRIFCVVGANCTPFKCCAL